MTTSEIYPELLVYVWNYRTEFMTEDEHTAWRHNRAVERINYGNKIGFHKYHNPEKDLSNDENVLKLLENGYEHFKKNVAIRILNEHMEELVLNLCPKCNKITRTPNAKQCRFCLHDWH